MGLLPGAALRRAPLTALTDDQAGWYAKCPAGTTRVCPSQTQIPDGSETIVRATRRRGSCCRRSRP